MAELPTRLAPLASHYGERPEEVAPATKLPRAVASDHTRSVLEFPDVLELVAGRAATAAGATRIRGLLPSFEREVVASRQARVWAMHDVVSSAKGWRQPEIPEVGDVLRRLAVAGSVMEAPDFAGLLTLLRSSRVARQQLAEHSREGRGEPLLPLLENLCSEPAAERSIEQVIGPDGQVRDSASPLLKKIRQALRTAEARLIELLENVLAALPQQYRAPDLSVTMRNGRWVIPVRREGGDFVGGIVHGVSGSGATLFVEPPAAIDACNRIRELEAEEAREVARILMELGTRLRPLAGRLAVSLDALTELDSLYACARFAIEFDCAPVELLSTSSGMRVIGARHPLLLAQGVAVVPFTLELEEGERTLLVSGPNTGGKTVLLKTVGLAVLLTQAGIPFPVAAGTAIPVLSQVFADIGDEQSIAQNLSTFSAHLRNIAAILREASDDSLVLLDELGAGTDPAEGAALGGAVLEELTRRGALTIATTHLGGLQEFAATVPGFVNGSLQFDAEAMLPTYRFLKGVPGRSYGIAIAERLGLAEAVVERARELLPRQEREALALLERLEAKERALAELEQEAVRLRDRARELSVSLEERERAIEQRERALRLETRAEVRRELLEARREIERMVSRARSAAGERDEVIRSVRREIEQWLASQAKELVEEGRQDLEPGYGRVEVVEFQPGSEVAVAALGGRRGRVLERRGAEYVVAVGSVKFSLRGDQLVPVPASERRVPASVSGELPAEAAVSEIDVRGLRVDEVAAVVERALDSAIRADLRQLRIIHGKGTGALRARVAEILRSDPRVSSFATAPWNEGGAGVTVVRL